MLKNIKNKLSDFLLNTFIFPSIILFVAGIFSGGFFLSDSLIQLVSNKEYYTLFGILSIYILSLLILICLSYFVLYFFKNLIIKSSYNLNFNIIKKDFKSKIHLKNHILGFENLFINYEHSQYTLEINKAYSSINTSVSITLNPILNNNDILEINTLSKLTELDYPSFKKNLHDSLEFNNKLQDRVIYLFEEYTKKNLIPPAETMIELIYSTVKYKIYEDLIKLCHNQEFKETRQDNGCFSFDPEIISLDSSVSIKFYRKDKLINEKIMKLSDFLKNKNNSIEYSRFHYFNIL